jgi:hypothetical protein
MPLTPDMRRSIDQIRDYLFGGGYPDPVSNAEQLSFLFFFYLVEGIDAENRARARFLKKPYTSLFDGTWELKNPLNAAAGLAVRDSRGASATSSRGREGPASPPRLQSPSTGLLAWERAQTGQVGNQAALSVATSAEIGLVTLPHTALLSRPAGRPSRPGCAACAAGPVPSRRA